MRKRVISALLTLCIILTLLPMDVLATEAEAPQNTFSEPSANVNKSISNYPRISNEREKRLRGAANNSVSIQSQDTNITIPSSVTQIGQKDMALDTSTMLNEISPDIFSVTPHAQVEEVGSFFLTGGVLGVDYDYADGVVSVLSDQPLVIQNKNPDLPTNDIIQVAKGISANITFAGINIDVSNTGDSVSAIHETGVAAFGISHESSGNVNIILAMDTVNLLQSGYQRAGLEKSGGTGGLTIKGTGKLICVGGNGGAGIGSCAYSQCNNITIAGGVIEATGKAGGAGIGGGSSSSASNIVINSGTINANAEGEGGAGIGGGARCGGSDIQIAGGEVIAIGGNGGSGIGGSGPVIGGSHITITGGTVTAIGGGSSAGIGGGAVSNGTDIIIQGGTVTATGGSGGAGIGGGTWGSRSDSSLNTYGRGENITISGGTIIATGGSGGAGIGGGFNGNHSGIIVNGNCTVFATCGRGGLHIGDGSGDVSQKTSASTFGWSGIVFKGIDGQVFSKDVTIDTSAKIPDGYTLIIEEGETLNIPQGVTLTIDSMAVVENNGTIRIFDDSCISGTVIGNQPVAYGIGGDTGNITTTVHFFSGWNPTTKNIFFDEQPSPYFLAASIDTTSVDALVGKYVLVTMEQGANSPEYTITDIKPVESKIGTVSATGEHSLTIDGTTYPIREDYALASHDGKEVLYHTYSGTIVDLNVLEEKTGTLEVWDGTMGRATIEGKEYPSNYVSSLPGIGQMVGQRVQFQVVNETGYIPLLTIKFAPNIPDEPIIPDSDSYIVERVKEYTSDVMYKQFESIMSSNDSDETKYQRLTELFSYYGFLDAREGISYLSNATPERRAYLALTTNEMYANYLAWDWLNNTEAGRGYRVVLLADGLTFNNELSTWLDPLTWVGAKDTPGVAKYKDMLYDFMDAQSLEVEITEYVSLVSNLANNSTSVGKMYAEELIDALNSCTSDEALQSAITSNNAKKVIADLTLSYKDGSNVPERKFTLSETSGFGKFAKAMGCATKFLSAYDITVNGILELIELDGKLAVYIQYRNFLTEIIYATELPWEMRLAATKVLGEIDSGAWGKVKDFAINLADLTGAPGLVEENFLTIVVGETGYGTFDGYLKAIKITSWCIDQVTDISGLVKGAAYMEGYAYLNMYYRNKLTNSKIAFLSDETPENAWKFFAHYNMLYQLRRKGEEATLKMFKLKELPTGGQGALVSIFGGYKNDEYEKVVQQTLGMLEDCKFTLPDNVTIPESVQYIKKSVISCPVDVEVYAPDGTYITTLLDGRESDITNEYGRFAVVNRVYTGTYAKVICMSQTGNYSIKVIGQDDGLVDFELATTTNGIAENYTFANAPISKGTVFEISTDRIVNDQIYDIDIDGDNVIDKSSMVVIEDETCHIAVSDVSLASTNIIMNKGESVLLPVLVVPENATRKNMIWISDNKDVVYVTDGKVTANSYGSATIYCVSQDNPNIFSSCIVNVADIFARHYLVRFNANGGTVKSTTMSTDVDGKLLTLPTATRSNYIFNGWYTSPTEGEQITTDTIFSGDTMVYAHWIHSGNDDNNPTDSDWVPSGNNSSQSAFSIVAPSASHGVVTISPKSATKGSTVTITATPDAGYELAALTVADGKGNELNLTNKGNGKYAFVMPGSAVTVNVRFEPVEQMPEFAPESNPNWVNPYMDVGANAWYYDAVKFVSESSLMNGIGNNLFAPDTNLSRAQLPQILYNKEGKPASGSSSIYADVSSNAWYTSAIVWASGNSIVEGYDNNLFGPNDSITREQLAVMLWRYAGKPIADSELPFNDASQISSYALPAMRWAVGNGILNGEGNGILDPKGLATRAQVAQMFMNYLAK